MTPILLLLAAYLIGAIPFGYVLVKLQSGRDVRAMGSGNIGATNVMRTAGRSLALLTLLLDIAKGTLAVWLADRYTNGSIEWMSLAAMAVMAGHAFPIFLRFKGGKAVASFVGAFAYLTPLPLLATAVLFVATVAITRYISSAPFLELSAFPWLYSSSAIRPQWCWPLPWCAPHSSCGGTNPIFSGSGLGMRMSFPSEAAAFEPPGDHWRR
jgi:acyl-phosphate glycerol 3-phosphate acyltransferase